MSVNIKSTIAMRDAWGIKKENDNLSFSECLKIAWKDLIQQDTKALNKIYSCSTPWEKHGKERYYINAYHCKHGKVFFSMGTESIKLNRISLNNLPGAFYSKQNITNKMIDEIKEILK